MKRGEIWFAETNTGDDRPVLVLTRDPVADRIGSIVVAAITTTIRGLTSELSLGANDGLTRECVASFDNLLTLPRSSFRRHAATASSRTMIDACTVLNAALGCG